MFVHDQSEHGKGRVVTIANMTVVNIRSLLKWNLYSPRNCYDSLVEAIFERSNIDILARDLAPPSSEKEGDFSRKRVNHAIMRPSCNTGLFIPKVQEITHVKPI